MKTIVSNDTKISLFLFENDKELDITELTTTVGTEPDFIVANCGSSNTTLYENVDDSPEDWVGYKYKYSGTVWSGNTDYSETLEEALSKE